MISENFGVNATVDGQFVNVSQDRFAKIVSQTRRLMLVESTPGD
jgi:hypothetical protein